MRKTFSLILAICMLISIIPAFSCAADLSNTKAEDLQLMGDVSLDKVLNTGDAVMILRWLSGSLSFTDEQVYVADSNVDGNRNTADASFILRVAAGLATPNYDNAMNYFNVVYATQTLPEEVTVTLPENEVVKAGDVFEIKSAATLDEAHADKYEFKGWQVSIDSLIYTVGNSFIMPESDVTLTAVWEEVEDISNADAKLSVKFYDKFNAEEAGTAFIGLYNGETVITAEDIVVPAGYKIANAGFTANISAANGVCEPSSITVDVIAVITIDGVEHQAINTIAGFDAMNKNLAGNYALNKDLDLGNTNRYPFGWFWDDLSVDDTEFTGVFDGMGHTIIGLYIDHTNNYASGADPYDFYSNVGLFSKNLGTIKNLNVYTREYDGESVEYGVFGDVNVGIIAGTNEGTIENCHSFGNAGSLDYIDMTRAAAGGITGNNAATGVVTKCSMQGGVEGFYWIGGLIGKNFGTLTESYFVGGVNSALDDDIAYNYSVRYIGGLCGGTSEATVSDCYVIATGNIYGDRGVGGLCGWSSKTAFTNCYVALNGGKIQYLTSDVGTYVGYVANKGTESGLYASETPTINNGTLPTEFVTVWDMQGACLEGCPDLINNRRGETLYTDD